MEKAYLPSYIFAAIAVIALVVTLVLIIKLIITKKEKRIKMAKTKLAAIVSALIVPLSAITAIEAIPLIGVGGGEGITYFLESMPDIKGLSYTECKENYSDKFDLVVQEEQWSFDYPEGAIIEQTPFVGSEYLVGDTTVKCIISKGPRIVTVSNVIGLNFEDARTILADNDGFTVGYVSEYSDDVPKGKVIATDPPEFEKAVYGSAVKVTVSGGKEPDVTDGTE